MTLTDLPTPFQGTRRVVVSPRVIAQLAARSHAQDFNQRGVLLGWWPAGPELLVVEGAIAQGDPEWRSQPGEPPQSVDVEPPFWDTAQPAQSGFWVRRVGFWAMLPGKPAHSTADSSPDEAYDGLTHRVHEAAFRRLIQELGGLEEPHVTLTFQEQNGLITGHAHVADPTQGTRPLRVEGRAAWPTQRPHPRSGVAFSPFRLPGDDDDLEAGNSLEKRA